MALTKGLEYYSIVDFTEYSEQFFYLFYSAALCSSFTWLLVFWLYDYVNKYLLGGLYIDTGLQVKTKEAKMEDFSFLDRFGKTATFIKNDLRLLKRSKRARTAVYMGIGILFYGIIFVPSEEILGSGFLFFWISFFHRWISVYVWIICTKLGQPILPSYDDSKY